MVLRAQSLIESRSAYCANAISPRGKLNAVSAIGQENDRLLEATRQSILALLGAGTAMRSAAQVEQIRDTFQADAGVLLWMENDSANGP